MVKVLGIDPGVNGACALFDSAGLHSTVFDIPTVGDGNKREIDYAGLRNLIWAHHPDVAFIEIVNAFMPRKKNAAGEDETVQFGATSMFRFGGAYYAIRAVVCCLNIPLRSVASPEWQAAFNLRGKTKSGTDAARHVVLNRYPVVAPLMQRKKDQHRAEAFLIAAYGNRKWTRETADLTIPE